jgi:transposase-like protein
MDQEASSGPVGSARSPSLPEARFGDEARLSDAYSLVRDFKVCPAFAARAAVVDLHRLQERVQRTGFEVDVTPSTTVKDRIRQAIVLCLRLGLSTASAAEITSVSKHYLRERLRQQGAPRSGFSQHPHDPRLRVCAEASPALQAALANAVQRGDTVAQMAKTFRMSKSTVRRTLTAAGVGRLKQGRPPKDQSTIPDAIRLVLENGYSIPRACGETGVAREPLTAALRLLRPRGSQSNAHRIPEAVLLVVDAGLSTEDACRQTGVARNGLLAAIRTEASERRSKAELPLIPEAVRLVRECRYSVQLACAKTDVREHVLRRALAVDEPDLRRRRPLKNAHRIPEAIQLVLAHGYSLERASKELAVATASLTAAVRLADPEWPRSRLRTPSQ